MRTLVVVLLSVILKNIIVKIWFISKLFPIFEIVSFDNLALEQMKIKRFFKDESWEVFNQGEHSFYINAVDKYFAPSSRSDDKTDWDTTTVKNYFKTLEKYGNSTRISTIM